MAEVIKVTDRRLSEWLQKMAADKKKRREAYRAKYQAEKATKEQYL